MTSKKLFALLFVLGMFALMSVNRHGARASDAETVTFNNQVIRILQQNCQACHHADDIAPFSLMTYGEAKLFAEVISEAAESREMPPWKPADGCGEFEGGRTLTDEQIETLARWVEAGKPEGDPADAPAPLVFTGDWQLGQPDVVLQPDSDFDVQIGDDIYRYFSLPTDLRGDRFLSAIDLKPGARSIVHHAIIYVDEKGESKKMDEADTLAGFATSGGAEFLTKGAIGWWMPGQQLRPEADGTAWLIPKGARIVLKIHYHVHHGGGQKDRTQVGLYFARNPVTKQLRTLTIENTAFTVPADESHFKLTASYPQIAPGQALHALGVAPHLQLLGHELDVQAVKADGSALCLISIDDWDSHWQGLYSFKEPVAIASGAQLNLTAYYNNSLTNPENPNYPPKAVRHGERTTDETCLAYIKYTLDSESRELSSPQITGVEIDSSGQLTVKGKRFDAGADIEVDGKRVADTRNHKKKTAKRLLSSEDWKALVTTGKQVTVNVLNPDGVRSNTVNFTRRD